MQSYIPGHTKMLNCLTYTIMYIHCKNEWVILTLIWLLEFQFHLRLYKSMLLSCLAR